MNAIERVQDPQSLLRAALAAHRDQPAGTILSLDAGRMPFGVADAWQREWQDRRRDQPDAARDLLLHVEHDPVFTITRRANPEHVLWDANERTHRGVTLEDVDRGGDVTFHGPGQLVVWPLLDLREHRVGTAAYMHRLEGIVVDLLASRGIPGAAPSAEMPGVWIDGAKICAIGVRVSRGLTRHGLALNHTVDLEWFTGIVPCGLPLPVTSIAERRPDDLPSREQLLGGFDDAFARHFSRPVHRVSWR